MIRFCYSPVCLCLSPFFPSPSLKGVRAGRHQWDESGKRLRLDLAWDKPDPCIDRVYIYRMPQAEMLGCAYAVRRRYGGRAIRASSAAVHPRYLCRCPSALPLPLSIRVFNSHLPTLSLDLQSGFRLCAVPLTADELARGSVHLALQPVTTAGLVPKLDKCSHLTVDWTDSGAAA